jgi:hypothetical protein
VNGPRIVCLKIISIIGGKKKKREGMDEKKLKGQYDTI